MCAICGRLALSLRTRAGLVPSRGCCVCIYIYIYITLRSRLRARIYENARFRSRKEIVLPSQDARLRLAACLPAGLPARLPGWLACLLVTCLLACLSSCLPA